MAKVGLFILTSQLENEDINEHKWPQHIPLIDEFDHQQNEKGKEKTL